MMTGGVGLWWLLLCAVALTNLGLWGWLLRQAWRAPATLAPGQRSWRTLQLVLSLGYVAGCAYRSFVPVFDVPRQTLVDAWWSSALVGRSVATLAELCFATQWMLVMRHLAAWPHLPQSPAQSPAQVSPQSLPPQLLPPQSLPPLARALAVVASRAMLPLTVVAEVCSWYAVLSTSNLGHVLEESIWAFNAACVSLAAATVWWRTPGRPAWVAAVAAAASLYAAYLAGVDVPMYWSRWLATEAAGHGYLDLAQGLIDAGMRRVVSHRWEDWRSEVVWMTLYFSVGVWFSLWLVRLPLTVPSWPPARPAAARA